jgi:Ribbon-helix-helix protein, copG family
MSNENKNTNADFLDSLVQPSAPEPERVRGASAAKGVVTRSITLPTSAPRREKRDTFSVHLKRSVNDALEKHVEKSGHTKSAFIEDLIEQVLGLK